MPILQEAISANVTKDVDGLCKPIQHGVATFNMEYSNYNKAVSKFLRHLKRTKYEITKTEFTNYIDKESSLLVPIHRFYYKKKEATK